MAGDWLDFGGARVDITELVRLEACETNSRRPVRLVWYAAYGSNMSAQRLACYLSGGGPSGGKRAYPGCRDPRPPRAAAALMLPGVLYFATESAVWTGGRAFYDPAGPGRTPARAYLLTVSQFSDIAAQEMYRAPGEDLDLGEAFTQGRAAFGEGRYETVVCPGALGGRPVVTLTAPWGWRDVPGNAPSAAYLHHLAVGLAESHRWDARRIAAYLASRPGAAALWTPEGVEALLRGSDAPS